MAENTDNSSYFPAVEPVNGGSFMERPKILLVDDNRLFLEMEKEFLQSCAIKVYTARNGQEALDAVRMILPDLVFMDLHMPQMDGDACCAAVKSDPDLKKVPIIMIVTSTDGEDVERCRQAGCDLVLTKPVDPAEFIATGLRFLPELSRIEFRIPCVTLVVFIMGGETFYGTSANLSTSGIFISFDGEVELEDQIRLTFLIPGAKGGIIEATGSIAWRNTGTPLCKPALPRGFGVKFGNLAPDAAKIIARFMARSENSGSKPVVEGAYMAERFF